jgi:hypothetical protein
MALLPGTASIGLAMLSIICLFDFSCFFNNISSLSCVLCRSHAFRCLLKLVSSTG